MNDDEARELADLIVGQWIGDGAEPAESAPLPGPYVPIGSAAIGVAPAEFSIDAAVAIGVNLLVSVRVKRNPAKEYLIFFDLRSMPADMQIATNSVFAALHVVSSARSSPDIEEQAIALSADVGLVVVGQQR